jgi:MscS family membrane protein
MIRRLSQVLIVSVLTLLGLLAIVRGVAPAHALQQGTGQSGKPEPTLMQDTSGEGVSGDESPTPEPTDLLEGVVTTRTPEPTATPGRFEQQIEELVETVGLARTTFLGISVANWASLAISLLYVLAGYLVGTWLIRSILPRFARRTRTEFDDRLLEAIGSEVRWLVVILALYLATGRLTFVSVAPKVLLSDVYFVTALILFVRIVFKVIDVAYRWARQRITETARGPELQNVAVLLARTARVLTTIGGLIILLAYFGVNVTALSAALGLGGLAFTLAAQDTIADAIAGVIILLDRPFRAGDRIEIPGAGTWGDVLNIGLRTTRIRTSDNRVIILPNSTIGSNQVTNFSYPDPSYRSETHLIVEDSADLEFARRLIIDSTRQVEGVMTDRPIDALYIAMGSSGIVFRVRWWIETYAVRSSNLDQVHTALQAAFGRAGIDFATTTESVKLRADGETVRRVASTFRGRGGTSPEAKTDA